MKLVRLRLCAAYVIVTISLLVVALAAVSGFRAAGSREAGNIRIALLRIAFIGLLRLSCRRRVLRAASGVSIVRTGKPDAYVLRLRAFSACLLRVETFARRCVFAHI